MSFIYWALGVSVGWMIRELVYDACAAWHQFRADRAEMKRSRR